MSLGSRIIKRGTAVTVASLSTPREPLLFLYPLWIQTFSTIAPELAYTWNGRPSRLSARKYSNPSAARCDFVTETGTEAPHENDLSEDEQYVPSQQSVVDHGHDETIGIEKETSVATTKVMLPSGKTNSIRPHAAQIKASAKEIPLKKSSSHLESNVNKALQAQAKARGSILRNRAVRKAYQADRREKTSSWIPDWRVILEQLRKYTPQHDEWLDRAVHISVPDSASEQLFSGVDDNVWNIAARYDSSVELANRKPDVKQCNEFLMSGSATAIQKTAAEVFRIAPGSRLEAGPQALLSADPKITTLAPSIESEDDHVSEEISRLVRSQSHRVVPAIRVDRLPKPSEWTTSTLAEYVNDLTSIKMPSHLHRLLYKKKEEHIMAVVQALREVFWNPDCRSSLSRTAFNKAIAFYVRANKIPDARAAFVLMEMVEIPPDPETFNILLRGAAKQEDLHVFQFVLYLMLRRGVMPNGSTWIAFLMANYDFRIKAYIVSAMKDKGLLSHTSTLKGVCEQVISQEIHASLDQGQSQGHFLQHMDSRYGVYWLTVDSGNRVLQALGERHLISRCWDFLQAMDARHIKPNQVSINTILNHCKQTSNVHGAIEIMERLPSLFAFVPDEHTYHALFELAWRTRSYNLARVVWKYACLNAGTSRKMRLLVRQSLLNGAETSNTNSSQYSFWKRQAGFIITSDVDDHPTAPTPKLIHEESPIIGLDVEKPVASLEKIGLRQTVDRVIERDQQLFKRWLPERPLGEMLIEAWEQDCYWQKARISNERKGVDRKLTAAIAVPLRPQ